jgi:hypothetical protein
MRRLSVTVACLASAVVCAQASAESLSADPVRSVRAHAAKPRHAAAARTASVEDIVRFSNPYAPPEGTTFVRRSAFPVDPYPAPREPHPRLSISMQKDGGGHTTGGFGWNF